MAEPVANAVLRAKGARVTFQNVAMLLLIAMLIAWRGYAEREY